MSSFCCRLSILSTMKTIRRQSMPIGLPLKSLKARNEDVYRALIYGWIHYCLDSMTDLLSYVCCVRLPTYVRHQFLIPSIDFSLVIYVGLIRRTNQSVLYLSICNEDKIFPLQYADDSLFPLQLNFTYLFVVFHFFVFIVNFNFFFLIYSRKYID
jgi:hypothetical protein